MQEIAEQIRSAEPKVSKPSWFRKITGIFHSKPQQEATPTPPQPISEPVLTLVVQEENLKPSVIVEPEVPAVQEAAPRLSKQERKRLKQEEYEKWKAEAAAGQPKQFETHSTAVPIAQAQAEKATVTTSVEITPYDLPHGIKEKVRYFQRLIVGRSEIPWLETDEVKIPLDLMTLATTKGEQFLYGSLIEGKKLNKASEQMTDPERRSADDALFVQLSELIQTGQVRDVEMVHNHISRRPIFETGNKNGQRVYFMRFDRLQGIPVIIRVAVGNKSMMKRIFSVITPENNRQIRKGGKL